MMCFYDPAKFSPRVAYRLEEGAVLRPHNIIWLERLPDLDDLIGMDDPAANCTAPWWKATIHEMPLSPAVDGLTRAILNPTKE